jgi:hypothetical protein
MGKTDSKERRTVRVDLQTFAVYPAVGEGANRIGTIVEYVRNDGARIRTRNGTSGPFTSHRLTAKFPDDDRSWVGQIKNEEMAKKTGRKSVILRPFSNEDEDSE